MKNKFRNMIGLTAIFVLSFCSNVFAAGTSYDMTTEITATVGELTTQFTSLLGIIVPAVLVIVGGKLVVTKGISWFKALTGKA